MKQIKSYKKDFDYSYTIGAYPTVELLKNKYDFVKGIYCHPKFENIELINSFNKDNKEIIISEKIFNSLKIKDNSLCVGVFDKYKSSLEKNTSHILLHNPSDMGNLGTIIRTVLGFSYKNIAVIAPACDAFNPKVIRGSMGALFMVNIQYFESFEQYREEYPDNECYPFMLVATSYVKDITSVSNPHTLIFGNEQTGLPNDFVNVGKPVKISQTDDVDSLNLAISVGIAAHHFSNF